MFAVRTSIDGENREDGKGLFILRTLPLEHRPDDREL